MASTTTTQVANGAWTSLGTGPLSLQAVEGDVYIQDATSLPRSALAVPKARTATGKITAPG